MIPQYAKSTNPEVLAVIHIEEQSTRLPASPADPAALANALWELWLVERP